MGRFTHTLMSRPIVIASLTVSLVVGTLLNAINQGGVMLEDGDLSWAHLVMIYFIPYCVASYSATKKCHAPDQ